MNSKIYKYLFVAYGNYSDITPNTENIKFFFNNFLEKQLIPNQFQEVNLNFLNINKDLKSELVNRLGLTSLDKKWEIRFDLDKVEFLFSEDISNESTLQVDTFGEKVLEYLEIIDSRFSKKHTRIGLVVQYLISEVNSRDVFNKHGKPLDYFKEEDPIEWGNKVVVRKIFEIPNKEIVNISNDLKWLKASIVSNSTDSLFEGLHLAIDINTLHENSNDRFDLNSIKSFLQKSIEIHKTIEDQNLNTFK